MTRGADQLLKWNDTEAEVAFGEDDFAWIEKQKGDFVPLGMRSTQFELAPF